MLKRQRDGLERVSREMGSATLKGSAPDGTITSIYPIKCALIELISYTMLFLVLGIQVRPSLSLRS